MSTLRKGFTLVEILIVVVILGILAAIVVPQFASASQDAIKSALRSQMQTVSAQVELYRVQNAGQLPSDDADPLETGGTNNGWGVLISNSFLKDEPFNGFTGTSVVEGDGGGVGVGEAVGIQAAGAPNTALGWIYNEDLGVIHAEGYDNVNNALATEDNYDDAAVLW